MDKEKSDELGLIRRLTSFVIGIFCVVILEKEIAFREASLGEGTHQRF